MTVRRAWRRVAEETAAVAGNVKAADRAAQDLQQTGSTLGGGGGGAASLGPQFQASSVAPAIPGAAPPGGGINLTGASLRIGGGGGGGGDTEGGGGSGIRAVETNLDEIAAIVEESGVPTPPKDSWNQNGTGPGETASFIFKTVLELGTSAPTRFLVWCAGWLAWGSPSVAEAGSTASRHGGGFGVNPGSGPAQWAEWRRQNPFSVLPPWYGMAGGLPAGWITSGGGGGGGGADLGSSGGGGGGSEAWARGLPGGGSDNSGGSWTGGSALDTLTASTGKAVADANKPIVEGLGAVVDELRKLNAGDGGASLRGGL